MVGGWWIFTKLSCRFEDETIWLSQVLLADLFQVTVPNINIHIKSILFEGELTEGATIKDYLIVRPEGAREVQRQVKYYSLDMILAIGYRIHSPRGTAFRQWATARLKEYLVKGFVLDDERLKNPPGLGVPDYFDEMLERIRDIFARAAAMCCTCVTGAKNSTHSCNSTNAIFSPMPAELPKKLPTV